MNILGFASLHSLGGIFFVCFAILKKCKTDLVQLKLDLTQFANSCEVIIFMFKTIAKIKLLGLGEKVDQKVNALHLTHGKTKL